MAEDEYSTNMARAVVEHDDAGNVTAGDRKPILQLVSAERLLQSIEMLEAVRKMILALLVLMVVVGAALAYFMDYVGDSRAEVRQTREETQRIEDGFTEVDRRFDVIDNNSARTQRLICDWFTVNNQPLPPNGDCDGR
jgi:hypothetical protein